MGELLERAATEHTAAGCPARSTGREHAALADGKASPETGRFEAARSASRQPAHGTLRNGTFHPTQRDRRRFPSMADLRLRRRRKLAIRKAARREAGASVTKDAGQGHLDKASVAKAQPDNEGIETLRWLP
jgi:hypothetical protein